MIGMIKMPNKDIMESLLKNPNLSEITYDNNIVTYQGKTIDISSLYLNDFFQSSYSELANNQNYITAEDFFNILDLHTKVIENNNNNNINDLANMALNNLLNKNNNNSIISINKYFELVNSNINEETAKKIKDFETEMSQCLKYEDYLLDDKRMLLNDYKNVISNISFQKEDNKQPELTIGQQYALKKFNQIDEDAKNFNLQKQKQKQRILQRKMANTNVSYGYANAFIVILSTIAAGIVTAITLYLIVK